MQGICHLTTIPLRALPTSKSEMVSQLLFGETYRVTSFENGWKHVLSDFDNYQGWINDAQFVEIPEDSTGDVVYLQNLLGELNNTNHDRLYITAGAQFRQNDEGHVMHRGKGWKLTGEVRKPLIKTNRDMLTSDSMEWLNAPYLWGGRTVMGVDCSGFTQVVYKLNGIHLPRDAYQQATVGETLAFLDETQPGDLAFFDNEDRMIIHVGMLLDSRRIIHAHGCVRIDKIDQEGIFNVDTGRYTHKLRFIKKIF